MKQNMAALIILISLAPFALANDDQNEIVDAEPILIMEPIFIADAEPVPISATDDNNPDIMPISSNPGADASVLVTPGESNCLPPIGAEFYTNMPSLDGTPSEPQTPLDENGNSETIAETVEIATMDFPLVAPNLDIHIPLAKLQSLTDSTDICAYLEYIGEDENGEHLWKLQKYNSQ